MALPSRKKIWYKDPTILTVGGIGAAAGLYVLAKNKGKTGTGVDAGASSTGAIPGAPYSSLGTDFYNAIQDSTSSLQDKLAGLQQSVQDVNLRISKLPVYNPAPIRRQPNPGYHLHRIGRVGQSYSLASEASRFGTTIATLRSLNPALRGKNSIPGGFALKVPA